MQSCIRCTSQPKIWNFTKKIRMNKISMVKSDRSEMPYSFMIQPNTWKSRNRKIHKIMLFQMNEYSPNNDILFSAIRFRFLFQEYGYGYHHISHIVACIQTTQIVYIFNSIKCVTCHVCTPPQICQGQLNIDKILIGIGGNVSC